MIEYTRSGMGQLDADQDPRIVIEILMVGPSTASAIVQSIKYVDHVHLVRSGGKWQIINVLWEVTKKVEE